MTLRVKRKYTALPSRECHSTSVIGGMGSIKEDADEEELAALPGVVCAEKREYDSSKATVASPTMMTTIASGLYLIGRWLIS